MGKKERKRKRRKKREMKSVTFERSEKTKLYDERITPGIKNQYPVLRR